MADPAMAMPKLRYVDPQKPRGRFYLQRRHVHVGRALVAFMVVAGVGVASVGCAKASAPSSPTHTSNAIAFACPRPSLRGFHLPTPKVADGQLFGKDSYELLLCRYSMRRNHPIVRRLIDDRVLVTRIVNGLNALPKMPEGTYNCPAINGDSILILARERRGPVQAAYMELTGCQTVANGTTVRWDLAGGAHAKRVFTLIERLTGGKVKRG